MMPAQKPGRSKQDYGTPRDFLDACVRRFGALDFDLAAHAGNHVCEKWLGPGSPIAEDTLNTTIVALNGNLWLNPPYDNIGAWAKKCADTSASQYFDRRGRILFLVPASIGANWFRDFVHGKSLVVALNGRLTFEGCSQPYPKDCILAVYGCVPGFEVWDWRKPWP